MIQVNLFSNCNFLYNSLYGPISETLGHIILDDIANPYNDTAVSHDAAPPESDSVKVKFTGKLGEARLTP